MNEHASIEEAAAGIRRPRCWVGVLAALLVLPWVGWALLRWFGLEQALPPRALLVPAVSFTPYVALTSVIALLVAAVLRRWWAAGAALAAAVLLAVAVVPRALPDAAPSPQPEGVTLRVLTLNLSYSHADAAEIVELASEEKADILSLQEVRPSGVERLERAGLAELLPHSFVRAGSGAAGGAIYSRYEMTGMGDVGARMGSLYMPQAELTVPGAPPVQVTSVHPMPPLHGLALWDAAYEALPAASGDDAVDILAGDFNATLDHAALRELIATGYTDAAAATGDGWRATWPARLPLLTLDHVLVEESAAVRGSEVHEISGSDHRAVLAEVVLPAA